MPFVGDRLLFEAALPRQTFRLEGEVRSVCRTSDGSCDVGVCWVGDADGAGALLESMIADARHAASERAQLRAAE